MSMLSLLIMLCHFLYSHSRNKPLTFRGWNARKSVSCGSGLYHCSLLSSAGRQASQSYIRNLITYSTSCVGSFVRHCCCMLSTAASLGATQFGPPQKQSASMWPVPECCPSFCSQFWFGTEMLLILGVERDLNVIIMVRNLWAVSVGGLLD